MTLLGFEPVPQRLFIYPINGYLEKWELGFEATQWAKGDRAGTRTRDPLIKRIPCSDCHFAGYTEKVIARLRNKRLEAAFFEGIALKA